MAATFKRARALVTLALHAVAAGQILEASPELIKQLADDGQVDPHKDAVAAALADGNAVVRSAIEQKAAELAAAAHALRVRIAELQDLQGKATDDPTTAALAAELAARQAELAELG